MRTLQSMVAVALMLVCLGSATAGYAQQPPQGPDYTKWDRTAERAENSISAGRASSVALEDLRNELADWRQQFSGAQGGNASKIETARAQLNALGQPPEDGIESADVAAKRQELNSRLADLQAPNKTAEVAFNQAEGLIRGIDQIIRDRQKEALLELGPSPLNPAHWGDGWKALYGAAEIIRSEFVIAWHNQGQQAETKKGLLSVIILAVFGFMLVVRGKRWSSQLVNRVLKGQENASAGRWLSAFVASLGALFLPVLGTYSLIEAVYATGMVGLRGDMFFASLLSAATIYFLARWLSIRIFSSKALRQPLMSLDASERRAGRVYGSSMGLVVAAFFLLRDVSKYSGWSEAANNVIIFPVIIIAAFLLSKMARLLLVHSYVSKEAHGEETYRCRMARILSRVILILAFIAPALAAIGYFKAAQALMLPSMLSLLVLGALLVLQRVMTELYSLLTGNDDCANDSLIPVFLGSLLVLASAPVFALIWGARVVDLTELWEGFTEGVSLGGTRISPAIFLTLSLVFALGFLITRLLQAALKNTVLPKTKMDAGGRNAIVAGVGYIGIFLAAIIAVTSAGIDLSSIAIVAGALSVGIGFGLQNIVSNFVAGIILLIERPISEGDWIEVGGTHGYVRDISVRSTRIETFDRSDVIVPNADFVSGTVTNYTRGNTVGRVIVPVGVAYGTDPRKVEAILKEISEMHPMVLVNPPAAVLFRGFGADSLDFEIRAFLRDVNWVNVVLSDMNYEIAARFEKDGIEIPFGQRDIWLRNPEALRGALSGAAVAEASDTDAPDVTDPDADAAPTPKGAPKK